MNVMNRLPVSTGVHAELGETANFVNTFFCKDEWMSVIVCEIQLTEERSVPHPPCHGVAIEGIVSRLQGLIQRRPIQSHAVVKRTHEEIHLESSTRSLISNY